MDMKITVELVHERNNRIRAIGRTEHGTPVVLTDREWRYSRGRIKPHYPVPAIAYDVCIGTADLWIIDRNLLWRFDLGDAYILYHYC